MDKAINNLTIPLGQLREEILVSAAMALIKTPKPATHIFTLQSSFLL